MPRSCRPKAVLYLNSDENGRGFLSAGGSDSLQHLLNEVAATVMDPETGVSVQARLRAHRIADTAAGTGDPMCGVAADAGGGGDLLLEALGSGSDFTPFLQHLGIATLSVEYGGEAEQSGVYHSRYDTFDHYVRFGDPDFKYGVALAQTNGRLMLRMAECAVAAATGGHRGAADRRLYSPAARSGGHGAQACRGSASHDRRAGLRTRFGSEAAGTGAQAAGPRSPSWTSRLWTMRLPG